MVATKDALAGKHGEYGMVLTNPPFGKKSSVTIVNEAGEQQRDSLTIHRDDFWASTSNKQPNFVQPVLTILKQHAQAAVVVLDNVLFEGGAGEMVRRALLKQADVHALLRLPTGIPYGQGVKARLPSAPARPPRAPTGQRRQPDPKSRNGTGTTDESRSRDAATQPSVAQDPHAPSVTVLRYFLERGRLAELRIPPDISPKELKRLFRHLEIDLLEHEEAEV